MRGVFQCTNRPIPVYKPADFSVRVPILGTDSKFPFRTFEGGLLIEKTCRFPCHFLATCLGFWASKAPRQGNRPMELTSSFVDLLPQFSPVFTAPTYQTFVAIVAGWVLSQRHRFITEVIFSSGHVGHGHWSRFHRFFSHAAWDLDTLSLFLASGPLIFMAHGARSVPSLLTAASERVCLERDA